jgi:hypothetical protein
MRLAFSGTVVDMCENAEPEFRILIEDLPLQNVVPEMSSDECCVLQDVLDERADFLAALDTRIVHQDAMTCIRELLKSVAHHPTPPLQSRGFTLLVASLSLQRGSDKIGAELRAARTRCNCGGLRAIEKRGAA